MNLDAPRLMAHCLLYDLDAYLATQKDIEFTRFMDDLDIGVDSLKDAKGILKCIDLILQTKQIRLNSGKTRILKSADARRHFKVFDNAFLDAFTVRVENGIAAKLPLAAEKQTIRSRIVKGLRLGRFDEGNGEKILKRWMTLATKTKVRIPQKTLYSVFVLRPNVRQSCLRYMLKAGFGKTMLGILNEAADSGQIVDEAAWLETTNAILGSKFRSNKSLGEITSLAAQFNPATYFGFYASAYLFSRTWQLESLARLITDQFSNWRIYPLLGRLRSEKSVFDLAFHQLKARNTSVPMGYTFHKFLTLMVALNNGAATTSSLTILRSSSQFLRDDAYLKKAKILK